MKYHDPCPQWAEKLAFRREDLSLADQAELEAHLKTCAACASAQTDYHRLIDQLGAVSLPMVELAPFSERLQVYKKETKRQAISSLLSARPQPHVSFSRRAFGFTASVMLALLLAASTILLPHMLLKTAHPTTHSQHSLVNAHPTFSLDPQHTHFNADEHTISPTNVSSLVQLWTVPIRDPIWSLSVTVNGVIYVSSHDSRLYALNAWTGATLWTAAIGNQGGISASCWPVVSNGIVYVGSLDSHLYALDARTGSTLWIRATGGSIWSPPVVDSGVVYTGSLDSHLYAFDAKTGSTLWITGADSAISASPVVMNGIVYINSQDSSLYALNARTGAILWSTAIGTPSPNQGFTSYWPVVANGAVYVTSQDSRLFAFDAWTGAILWSVPIGAPDLDHNASFTSSWPVVANGVVYIGSHNSYLYAFDARLGTPLWASAIGVPSANSSITSSWPVVANGVVYVSAQGFELYAIDARTGAILWTTDNAVFTSPVIANGIVYVGSQDSMLYAFGIKTPIR